MSVHRIAKGLDLPLAGEPAQAVDVAPPATRVALVAADYVGLKPTMLVQAGDRVLRGTPLFEDKKTPGVRYTAPAAGVVAAIHRGEMRAFQSIVIDVDPADGPAAQVAFASYTGAAPETQEADAVRALIVESGMWSAFRARPFSRVPAPSVAPHSIFVTAIDTHPHAPSVDLVLADRIADFHVGLRAIAKLCSGKTYVCKAAGSSVSAPASERIVVEEFAGPHPAGTPGLHIHLLDPVRLGKTVWHIGYQDVAAIGRLLATGKLDVERVIALAGPGALRPRLLRSRLGASLDGLTRGELQPGVQRVISGSVLDGRTAMGTCTAISDATTCRSPWCRKAIDASSSGGSRPGRDKFSLLGVVLGAWSRRRKLALTTTTNGGERAMVPIGAYERVLPFDLMPTFLLRALITGNVEWAEEMGCLELDEEDLALCTFVCPGKFEYGPLLRSILTRIEHEEAVT